MTTSGLVYALVGVAVVIGLGTLIAMLRRPPSRPPEAPRAEPISFALELSDNGPHWRVDSASATSITIDIVSHRMSGSDEWVAEPIVEPIPVAPGGSALIPTSVGLSEARHELVVAWSELLDDGPVTRTGSFVAAATSPVAATPVEPLAHRSRVSSRRRSAVVAMIALLAGGTAAIFLNSVVRAPGDDGELVRPLSAPPGATDVQAVPDSSLVVTPTSQPSRTTATAAPTSVAATSPTVSSTPSESTISTSAMRPAPTSTPAATSDPAVVTGPRIELSGRVEDCRHGAACLIVGFEIVDFATRPATYICEFDDGSRFTFRFGGSGVEEACSASGADPSITIEVDGVRSSTVTRASYPADS